MVVVPPTNPPVVTPPSGQDCVTCKFGITRDLNETKRVLECRFSDPISQGTFAVWPKVQQTDWCGRWAAK